MREYTDRIDQICYYYLSPFPDVYRMSVDLIVKRVLNEELIDPGTVVTDNAFVYSVDWLYQSLRILAQLQVVIDE